MTHHPEAIDLRRDRLPSQFQAIENTRVGIDAENERKREEHNLEEMVNGDHLGMGKLGPYARKIATMNESILKTVEPHRIRIFRVENGFGWKYSFWNMAKSSLGNPHGANQALLDEFKTQEDVQMYTQLTDYGEFRGSDLSSEMELAATPNGISAAFAKQSWLTLKHHLFNTHVPQELFKAIREISTIDKKDQFKHDRLFRGICKISIS